MTHYCLAIMKTILVTGGSGLVGKALTNKLLNKGYKVSWLSRKGKPVDGIDVYKWDIKENYIEDKAIETADIIVHLAGAPIADKRWTKRRKQELYESRVSSSLLLLRKCNELKKHPEKYISASAIGYYGNRPGETVDEKSRSGSSYLSKLCLNWEDAADGFKCHDTSVSKLRLGLVFANEGGSLPVFRKMLNAPILPLPGNGKQYSPWIHIRDLVRIIVNTIENNELVGSINCSAPENDTFKDMIKTLAKVEKTKIVTAPSPQVAVKLALGEMSEIFLMDLKLKPQKLLDHHFQFKYPNLN